jgi:polar amino acid transport system substrate-binding protein
MSKLWRFSVIPFKLFLLLVLSVPLQSMARPLDVIMKSGEIRIGLNIRIPPRASLDDKNEPAGFEVDVAQEIAKRLGVKLVIVPADSNERIPFVSTGRIDAVMGGMTRTTDRAKIIDFTVPLSTDSYGVITKKEFNISRLSDLNKESITIVMTRGTAVLPKVQSLLPNAKFLILDSLPDRTRAFVQGRGQAIVDIIDAAPISIVRPNPGIEFNIFPVAELPPTHSCIGVAKGNDTLRRWLNDLLYDLHNEGFIKQSWKKHFLQDMFNYPAFTPYY